MEATTTFPQVRSGVEPRSVHAGADIGTPWSGDRFNRLTLSFSFDTVFVGPVLGRSIEERSSAEIGSYLAEMGIQ